MHMRTKQIIMRVWIPNYRRIDAVYQLNCIYRHCHGHLRTTPESALLRQHWMTCLQRVWFLLKFKAALLIIIITIIIICTSIGYMAVSGRFCVKFPVIIIVLEMLWCQIFMAFASGPVVLALALRASLTISTARRVCITRTMPWQDVCMSVCLCVCPSVYMSVTRRYSVDTTEHILTFFTVR